MNIATDVNRCSDCDYVGLLLENLSGLGYCVLGFLAEEFHFLLIEDLALFGTQNILIDGG